MSIFHKYIALLGSLIYPPRLLYIININDFHITIANSLSARAEAMRRSLSASLHVSSPRPAGLSGCSCYVFRPCGSDAGCLHDIPTVHLRHTDRPLSFGWTTVIIHSSGFSHHVERLVSFDMRTACGRQVLPGRKSRCANEGREEALFFRYVGHTKWRNAFISAPLFVSLRRNRPVRNALEPYKTSKYSKRNP